MPQQWTLSELPTTVTAGHYFNQTVISGWLHRIVSRVNSAVFLLSYRLVCLSIHPSVRPLWPDCEGHSSHLGKVVQTRHSIHSDPWGRQAIDNSLSAVSQFVHFWNWPWTLLTHCSSGGWSWKHPKTNRTHILNCSATCINSPVWKNKSMDFWCKKTETKILWKNLKYNSVKYKLK